MSIPDRILNKHRFAWLYKRVSGFDLGKCAYCGCDPEVLDHVPPLKVARDLDLDKFYALGGKLLLYPSCAECNTILGYKRLMTYEDRLLYLLKKYLAKAKTCAWSDEELSELGFCLKQGIFNFEENRRRFCKKIEGIERSLCAVDVYT